MCPDDNQMKGETDYQSHTEKFRFAEVDKEVKT